MLGESFCVLLEEGAVEVDVVVQIPVED